MYRLFGFLLLLSLLVPPVYAQHGAAATIHGQVVDPTGAVIGDVEIVLHGESTKNRSAVTRPDGSFTFEAVSPGSYTINAVRSGFSTESSAVSIEHGTRRALQIVMRPAGRAEEVTVTATRSSELVSTIPGAVSVIDDKQLKEQPVSGATLADTLGRLVPGMAAGSETVSIFGQTLRGRPALVMVDGVPQSSARNVSRNLTVISPGAIDRIEVVRGATSIYGDGATGGIINIISKSRTADGVRYTTSIGSGLALVHPSDSPGLSLEQTATGKFGDFDFLLNGSFDYSGSMFDAEGDRIPPDPHGQGGLADTRGGTFLGKVGYSFTPEQHLQFMYSKFKSVQMTDYTFDPAVKQFTPGTVKSRTIKGLQLDEDEASHNTLYNLTYRHDNLLGSRVEAQAFYRDYLTRFFPFDGRTQANVGRQIIQSRLESNKGGFRVQGESRISQSHGVSLVWGVDGAGERTSQPVSIMDATAYVESGGLVFRKTGDKPWVPPIRQQNLGVFGQAEWAAFERFLLRGGVRHERIDANIKDFTTLSGAHIAGGDLDYRDTLYNLGAVYTPLNWMNVFASFSQGFSAPDLGLILRGAPAGATVDTLPFDAQKVNMVELGTRLYAGDFQGSVTGYYNTSELGTSSGGFNQPAVRAPERVYGFEITGDYKLGARWNVSSSVSWIEGKSDPNLDGLYTYLNSYRIPPIKVTGAVEHQTLSNWRNRLQMIYSGDRKRFGDSTVFGERPVNNYYTFDYITSIGLSRGTLQFAVENMLNRFYFTKESQLVRSGGNDSYTAARGATISTKYTFSF